VRPVGSYTGPSVWHWQGNKAHAGEFYKTAVKNYTRALQKVDALTAEMSDTRKVILLHISAFITWPAIHRFHYTAFITRFLLYWFYYAIFTKLVSITPLLLHRFHYTAFIRPLYYTAFTTQCRRWAGYTPTHRVLFVMPTLVLGTPVTSVYSGFTFLTLYCWDGGPQATNPN
jgi:hypothetical protein